MSSKFPILILIWICLGAVPAAAQSSGSHSATTEASLRKGISLFQQKRYAEARAEFLRATEHDQSSAEGYFYLGMVEMKLGDVTNAKNSLLRALELNPRSQNALYNLGVLLLQENKAAESIRYFQKAGEIGPPAPEISLNLIRAYLEAGDKDAALKSALGAEKRFDTPAFHLALGRYYLTHGLAADARASLEKANRQAPSEPEVVLPLVNICLEQRDLACAQEALGSIKRQAGDLGEYHYLLAQVHLLTGRTKPAVEEMQVATHLEPKNPTYWLTLGRFYQKSGDQRQAISVLEQAAALAPENAEIPYSIAISYFVTDDFERASKHVDRALQLDPSFDKAVFLEGISYFALGKLTEAENILTHALRLAPRNPYFLCFLGMVLFAEDHQPEASACFQKTLRLDPSYALAHYQLGRLLGRGGKYAEARTELETAITLQPDLPEAYYQLGRVYLRLGEKEKADRALEVFKKYRAEEYSERQELLRQMQEAVRGGP